MKKRLNKNQNNDGDTKDINRINKTTKKDKESSVIVDTNSSSITTFDISNNNDQETLSYEDISALVDDSFWDGLIDRDNNNNNKRYSYSNNSKLYNDDDMEFWFDLLTSSRRIEEFSDMPDF